MGVTEILALTLSIIDKVMDKLPTYDQMKKQQYMALKRRYELEAARDFPLRDDNLVELLRRDLVNLITIFAKEIL
jgi:hypothetical protein